MTDILSFSGGLVCGALGLLCLLFLAAMDDHERLAQPAPIGAFECTQIKTLHECQVWTRKVDH